MAARPKNFSVKKDGVGALMKSLATLGGTRVYAGVPADKAGRTEEDGQGPINNAALMYIHENGAPEANLPARPVVHPAIAAVKPQIVAGLKKAGDFALNGQPEAVLQEYNAVGMIAQNAMRERITEGPFAPLSPKTVAQRAAQRGTRRRKGEKQYLDLVDSGVSPAEAQAQTGIKPLINTGQLRRALTYVIRKIRWKR